MVGVNKLKQMVGVAINTYLVAQRELEYHLVTLLCSRWASRAELLRSLNNISTVVQCCRMSGGRGFGGFKCQSQ